MAYLNGEFYVVREGDSVLISHNGHGDSVRLPLELFDAVCLMRFAQMRNTSGRMTLQNKMLAACDMETLGGEDLRTLLGLPSLMEQAKIEPFPDDDPTLCPWWTVSWGGRRCGKTRTHDGAHEPRPFPPESANAGADAG